MGQQQLLLVILVTIIVGIATVVAINIFGTSAENANADAVRQDLLTIATAAEGWFLKPAMMGGGGGTYTELNFEGITFPADEITGTGTAATTAENENGVYVINPRGADGFTVTATPSTFTQDIQMVVLRTLGDDGRIRPVVTITTLAPAG